MEHCSRFSSLELCLPLRSEAQGCKGRFTPSYVTNLLPCPGHLFNFLLVTVSEKVTWMPESRVDILSCSPIFGFLVLHALTLPFATWQFFEIPSWSEIYAKIRTSNRFGTWSEGLIRYCLLELLAKLSARSFFRSKFHPCALSNLFWWGSLSIVKWIFQVETEAMFCLNRPYYGFIAGGVSSTNEFFRRRNSDSSSNFRQSI